MRVSKVNELFKCRTLTAGQWSLTPWRRALELCGGEKVKAGTDGEDGKGQMLGRKRQIRRKRDREKGRQTEKETERDGLKMATKSRAICGYKDGSGFKSFPHSHYSCFSFVFVDKGLKIRVYGKIERRWWGAISCFQTCMIWRESDSHFLSQIRVYSQPYLSIIPGDQLSHKQVNLFIWSAHIAAYHTTVQLSQDWLCASVVDPVDKNTYLIKPHGKIRTCRKHDRQHEYSMTNYDTPW